MWTNIDAGASFLNLEDNGRFVSKDDLPKIEKKTFELINVYACATTRQVCLFNANNRILRLLHKRCPHLDAITLTIPFKDDFKNLKLQILSTELTKLGLEPSSPPYTMCGNSLPSFSVNDLSFPKLQMLSLVSFNIELEGLRTIRCLTLSNCKILTYVHYFEGVAAVLENLSCLEALHLTEGYFDFHHPPGIRKFFEVLSKRKTLRCLQLRTFISSHKIPFNFVYSQDSFKIMTIELGNTLCSLNIASIDDAVVHLIAENLRKLKFLNLSGNSEITDSGFASFSGHPCLEIVDITNCWQITYNAIAMTIETLPRIEKLFVTDYRDRTVLDWVQFNRVRHRMNHLKVDITRKVSHSFYLRDICPYCASLFRY